VENKLGRVAHVRHEDPQILREVGTAFGRDELVAGGFNFGSLVGRTTFELSDGYNSLALVLEVRPTKLNYEDDFEDLLIDVSAIARQLAFEFLSATSYGAELSSEETAHRTDWLTILGREVGALDRAFARITEAPHPFLTREVAVMPVHRVRRTSSVTRRAIVRGRGEGPWMLGTALPSHRARVPTVMPKESQDSNEHRWLRHELEGAVSLLNAVQQEYAERRVSRSSRSRPASGRDLATEDRLNDLKETLARYPSMSPFSEAQGLPPVAFSSLALQNRPGYREAYQGLLRLKMALRVTGSALEVPLRELAELYEMWCFAGVVRAVGDALGRPLDASQLLALEDTGARLRLKAGVSSEVTFGDGEERVVVAYNREYRGLTGAQRPDVVIEVRRPEMPPILIVLDAKYRVERDDADRLAPPIDALGQLHRYRDAITLHWHERPDTLGRPVVRGAILFPMDLEESVEWAEHPFSRALAELGIGALPFLPGNLDFVSDWLTTLLGLSSEQLAKPGPPFWAWEVSRERGSGEDASL